MAKKMKKKVLCCLVVLIILTSAMPVSVFAVQESSSSETVSAQGDQGDCPSVVKFKGTATTDENNVGFICYGSYYCKVKVEELLSNPGNKLKSKNEYTVCYGDSSKNIKTGDKLEVYGEYYHTCGPFQWVGHIIAYNDGYYIKKTEKKKPDLIIKDISWSPSSPDKGDTIKFTVKIKNQGSGSAGSSTVKYYIDGSYVGSDSVSKLSAGSTSTETFTWTASKCGEVKVKAVADANKEVTETTGKNNDRTETVSIKCPTLKPDLIITDISWSPSSPDKVDTIAFTVTIKNQGSGSAGSSTVNYYVDGSYVGSDSVPALSAGSTSTQTFTWTANKCGNVQVKAVADANNAVSESNDKNNDRTETINVICGEKTAPEIVKVEYPTTCVKEGEDATISVTVNNNGGASSEGYISVSFPNDEQIYDVSGTGSTYNKLYPKGSWIWNNKDQQMESVDPLVELLDTTWVKGQQETITMNVKPNSGSEEIVFYVRAALKNADGTYERDPTYSGDKDQQGWCVERHAIDMCPKEACVIIDDDTCVGYKVYVDDVYLLTEGVSETLDGSCTVYVAGGTHTIEIRDNGRYTSITRNFEGTYTWNSMPDNWCKGNAAVKFRGVIVKESLPISFYNYKIKIDEILMDPSGVLNSGDEIWVWAFSSGPAKVDSVSIDDKVEVSGIYDGEPHREVKLETGEHYLKNLEKQEIKFNGTAIDYFERIGAWGWNVTVDEIISGPPELQGHTVSVALWSVADPPGYMDYNIEPGDKVRIHGMYVGEDAVTLSGSEDYYLTKDYETEEGYKWITIGEVTTFDCCDTKGYFEVSTHGDWLLMCLKIKASTGECLQGHGFVFYGPDCFKTGCLIEDLAFLDASKGMIELWPQEWDQNMGDYGAVKVRYKITCYDPPENKLDRKAWIPAAIDTVSLGFGEKDFRVYIYGSKSESGTFTGLLVWGGAKLGLEARTPHSYEDKIDVRDVKEGDSFELEVPSGKINLKILQFVWDELDYLDKIRVEYKMTSAPKPKLTITGGYSDYKPPLQVFFQGSEVHVSVQNPREYTYVVEYWDDTNDNLEVDDNEWQRLPDDIISTTTTSDSEFDIPLPDLMPLGLYRVKIEGTDYVSNDFFVIFNPLNCGLTDEEIDKYCWSEVTGGAPCARYKLNIIDLPKYIRCRIWTGLLNSLGLTPIETNLRNNERDMLLIMASNWDNYQHFVTVPQQGSILDNHKAFLHEHMKSSLGALPPSDIREYINAIKGNDPIPGDCDCYATFLVGLARTSGIPARLILGAGKDKEGDDGDHAWIEAYYNGGWQVWDPFNEIIDYANDYKGYLRYYISVSEIINFYIVVDEDYVDRSTDYGVSTDSLFGELEQRFGSSDLHAYDYQGRHVGVDYASGVNDLEIPDAYHYYISDTEGIAIFGQNDDILLQIVPSPGESDCIFNLTIAKTHNKEVTTVTYEEVPITETEEATVKVSSKDNRGWLMVIKDYADGSQITRDPDSID